MREERDPPVKVQQVQIQENTEDQGRQVIQYDSYKEDLGLRQDWKK